MRIAVPVTGDMVSASLGACDAIRFYEDDHGRIIRQFGESVAGGADAALRVVERRGVDTLVCAPLPPEEKRALALSGLLVWPNASGTADEAARAYLGEAIARDPNNTCHSCGF